MGAVATFDWTLWSQTFPEFVTTTTTPPYTALTQAQVTNNILPIASSLHANDGSGPITDPVTQLNALNLMVAHVAQLMYGSSIAPRTGLVGRISGATEGSVSVQVDLPVGNNPTLAWLNQTTYGALYAALTTPYRTARYRPHPQRQAAFGAYGRYGRW